MKSNFNLFKEMETMCEALRELMKDELEERERIAKEDGKKEGEEFGETRVNQLNQKLISLNRFDDIVKSVFSLQIPFSPEISQLQPQYHRCQQNHCHISIFPA